MPPTAPPSLQALLPPSSILPPNSSTPDDPDNKSTPFSDISHIKGMNKSEKNLK